MEDNEGASLSSEKLHSIAQKAMDVYLLSKQPNGDIGGIDWWQAANGYTAIALHDIWSGSKQNYTVLSAALRQCEHHKPGFINEFCDDTLWWGLCCLHVYTIGGDTWFREKAQKIWHHIRDSNCVCGRGQIKFRDMDMEGACYWTTNLDEQQVNSVTTGLFAELSVRMALIDHTTGKSKTQRMAFWKKSMSKGDLIEIARCSLGWILRCRYREGDAIVLDNILLKEQRAQDWTFTYTTGVAIGVCALLYEATAENEYLDLACDMAQKAMRRDSWVEENGVLTERGSYGKENHKPWQNSDAVGFKAVLVRHLATLYGTITNSNTRSSLASETAASIQSFISTNFQSQQDRNTNGNGQYGPWWNGPFETPTSHSQMAVLDVMAAAVLVNKT